MYNEPRYKKIQFTQKYVVHMLSLPSFRPQLFYKLVL